MPIKDIEKRKIYQKKYTSEWYKKNSSKVKKNVKNNKQKVRHWYKDFKRTCNCELCGYEGVENPSAISFHHYNDDKEYAISEMVGNGCSIELIKNEIDKCQILCENCHKKIHYNGFTTVEWFLEFRKELVCEECEEKDYRCIELHHIDPKIKILNVSYMFRRGYGIDRLVEEISKCKSLCANCHRKQTYKARCV